jgi:hypothetical protein
MTAKGGYWQRHPKKELQALLILFHEQGWRIIDPPKYYKAYCACSQKHKTTVHLSPSGANYITDKEHWLARQPCYNKN